jgi:DMSO reductase anchor subunit
MCVDRLDMGLKPACVSACLGHALEFGEVAAMEKERGQALIQIAGFPEPSISQPNIRFKQIKKTPEVQFRTDLESVTYINKQSQGGGMRPLEAKPLSWKSIHSTETPLVFFTLLAQMTVGGFLTFIGVSLFCPSLISFSLERVAFIVFIGSLFIGLALSTGHLGKPQYCYRALNNLRYSWVSREILTVGSFFGGMAVYAIFKTFHLLPDLFINSIGAATALVGLCSLFAMTKCYLIPARPFWNHSHTALSFCGSMVLLGTFSAALILFIPLLSGSPLGNKEAGFYTILKFGLSGITVVYLFLFSLSRQRFYTYLKRASGESQASFKLLQEAYPSFLKFNHLLSGLLFLNIFSMIFLPVSPVLAGSILLSFFLALAWQIVDRALFYAVVIPTTMPGAFFLKNKGFEAYARETGLAEDDVVGVLSRTH